MSDQIELQLSKALASNKAEMANIINEEEKKLAVKPKKSVEDQKKINDQKFKKEVAKQQWKGLEKLKGELDLKKTNKKEAPKMATKPNAKNETKKPVAKPVAKPVVAPKPAENKPAPKAPLKKPDQKPKGVKMIDTSKVIKKEKK